MLTVYGIEITITYLSLRTVLRLQQCLPFTVLKSSDWSSSQPTKRAVATVLTVYGIET